MAAMKRTLNSSKVRLSKPTSTTSRPILLWSLIMTVKQLYFLGNPFPEYACKNDLVTVTLEADGDEPAFLYLPMPDVRIERELVRFGLDQLDEASIDLAASNETVRKALSYIGDTRSVDLHELNNLKLYMPMTVDYYERDEWGNMENEPTELTGSAATAYADNINAALNNKRLPEEKSRGLMEYYHEKDSVNDKVKSFVFTAEVKDDRLFGVAECKVRGELNTDELDVLKEYVAGQAADGFGEGFEQRGIATPDCIALYAHLWQWGDWYIKTEQELDGPKLAEGLPELCFSTLKNTGELIILKRGESGCYHSDWSTDDRERNVELAREQNERLGVSAAQEQAMSVGSMFGWEVSGADPQAYEQRMGVMDIV